MPRTRRIAGLSLLAAGLAVAQTTPRVPRSYALVIGIATYPHLSAEKQLKFAERDAESVYSILISPQGGNFRAENVRRLLGADATLEALRRQLESWLPSTAGEGDRVLIYFAGHGFVNEGKAYFAPYDFDPNSPETTGYAMDALGNAIGEIRARSKILLTDACHSGAIRPEESQNVNRALIDLKRSVFSLTASRGREQSFESAEWGGGHGIFTYYLVMGLQGQADEDSNGIVTADELQDYVYRNVREATGGRQNPTSQQGSYDPQMMLAYVPARAQASASSLKFGTLVFESKQDGVEVFIDGKAVGVVGAGKPLVVPGLMPGIHTIKGVKLGYEPDGPREETVYPGEESTVTIRISIPRRRNRAALEAVDRGVEFYQKGYEANYRKAAEYFQRALAEDPNYSQAALYLARTYHALYAHDQAEKYFRKAIEIDPDYLEARAGFGGMLLDIGDTDEAIRQFHVVLQREPGHVVALTNLAQAYRMKELYAQAIESAQKAIRLSAGYAEPHLWLAESLRLSGQYERSASEYDAYLRFSALESGRLNYYVVGFLAGLGKKKRAAQQDIWKDLQSLAYFGMCDCQRKQSRFERAIEYCRKALFYDPSDPYAHFALGLSLVREANRTGNTETLSVAVKHFRTTVEINPHLTEASLARQNIANIEAALKKK